MTELIIGAIIVLLAVAFSVYRVLQSSADQTHAAYDESLWWTLPM